MTRRRCATVLLAALLALGLASPAAALEARVIEMRVAGGSLFAAIELKDLLAHILTRELLQNDVELVSTKTAQRSNCRLAPRVYARLCQYFD